jgi:hypothetical protein
MSRLVTGEFSDAEQAGKAVSHLVHAGIPREEIFVETELPPAPTIEGKRNVVPIAEAERRIAGTETGILVGLTFGVLGGIGLAIWNESMALVTREVIALAESGKTVGASGPLMSYAPLLWPFTSLFWSMVAGALFGIMAGAGLGWVVDTTLDRLGAGPAKARGECLVTVWADGPDVAKAQSVLFRRHARHVLRA